tara:strand:- start:282 stop:1670 length:1389 start_codon:yes stop_codon:yes gene_type:complete
MSAGHVVIVGSNSGSADTLLTANPQITWFKDTFKRYSNFAMYMSSSNFNAVKQNGGEKVKIQVTHEMDLLGPQFARITMGVLGGPAANWTICAPCRGFADAYLKQVTAEIGHQQVAQYSKHVAAMHYHLVEGAEHKKILDELVPWEQSNQIRSHYGVAAADGANVSFWSPLRFWWSDSSSQYLPMVSMQYHNLSITLDLDTLDNTLECAPSGVPAADTTITSGGTQYNLTTPTVELMSTCVLLDTAERQKFSSLNACCAGGEVADSLEYLVGQHQEKAGTPITGTATGAAGATTLFTNHPVSEVVSMFQNSANETKAAAGWTAGAANSADPLNYTCHTHTSAIVGGAGSVKGDSVKSLDLKLNNHTCYDYTKSDPKYFRLVQPLLFHQGAPDDMLYCMSHSLNPDDADQPSGSANYSRIDNVEISYTTANGANGVVMNPYIISRNYNVFRVTAGLGGMIFHS